MAALLPPMLSVLLALVLFGILWQIGSAPFTRRPNREEAERKIGGSKQEDGTQNSESRKEKKIRLEKTTKETDRRWDAK